MSVTSAYMYSVGNLSKMLEALQKAQVPARFTHSFLKTLGFKSTNDRAFINVLKGLGFLDSNSTPTGVYKSYRDKMQAKKILGQQVKKAYPDLFMADENIHAATVEELKGKLATITGKDGAVVAKMSSTFKALCGLSDFSGPPKGPTKPKPEEERVESPAMEKEGEKAPISFSHTLYINLPATRDVAVYDAIFKSIREHLQ